MKAQSMNKNKIEYLGRSLLTTGAVYVLTAFHHYYGAVLYQSPWRKDVVWQGGIIFLFCLLLLYLYKRFQKKLYLMLYLLISFLVFGFAIGIVEGAYNHVLKNIFYFAGMNIGTWRKLFPAPAYEIPDNWLFETTGILQCVIGIIQVRYLWKVYITKYKKSQQISGQHKNRLAIK
ncbi:hypothetical protein [Arachidicoccus soli]|uniref:Uncharacterized protein n=1 Tax=Arachidicoccus soli TaxID=2341117 RepID=A0A386HR62_9BACT|nr:hypothetical protein [Arachidicoccus soli]AYD48335.1 hypothetical protein D6B99_12440 [Arachidicoccus soli]